MTQQASRPHTPVIQHLETGREFSLSRRLGRGAPQFVTYNEGS